MIWLCFVTLFRTNHLFLAPAQTPCVQPTTHCLHTKPKTVKRILRSTFSALRYAQARRQNEEPGRALRTSPASQLVLGTVHQTLKQQGATQVKSRFTTRVTRSQGLRTWTTQTHVNSWPTSREHWCGHPANHPGETTSQTHCETKGAQRFG